MTKETKIGLLAGLAFIIVIGIVLSDHLTSSTEPPPAALANAGNSVRRTVDTPARAANPIAVVVPPPNVAPNSAVPTPGDLENQATASRVITVGGPSISQQSSPQGNQISAPQQQAISAVNGAQANRSAPDRSAAGSDSANTALARLAQQNGEPIVNVTPTLSGGVATAGGSDYTVQPTDTLSRIAAKTMGSSSKANIDAIIKANPALAANPNMIVAGKTLKIPAASSAMSTPAPSASAPAPAAAQTAQNGSPAEYWYTVKDGDNLTRIATEQLGTANYASIKELNKDILKGGDTIYPNMRLRLPGKPIASAN